MTDTTPAEGTEGHARTADDCRRLGWLPGTRLAGDEGYGETVIEITALGEQMIIAVRLTERGEPVQRIETTWTLDARDWRVVRPTPPVPAAEDQDERITAWHRVASHPFFKPCFATEGPLIDAMIDALDEVERLRRAATDTERLADRVATLRRERDEGRQQLADLRALVESGEASDGHHTHSELYEYRMLYNAHAARGWLVAGIPVVKSWRHSDGEPCFGGGWFIVTATLPTGQVSNHYQAEHWDLFAVPEVDLPPEYDDHTPADAADRLRIALAGSGEQPGANSQPAPSSAKAGRNRPAPVVPDSITVDPETFAAMSDPAPDDAPALSAVARARAGCGCDLSGMVPPAVHLVDNHDDLPCPKCGGDRLRPDLTGSGRCHAPRPVPSTTTEGKSDE